MLVTQLEFTREKHMKIIGILFYLSRYRQIHYQVKQQAKYTKIKKYSTVTTNKITNL